MGAVGLGQDELVEEPGEAVVAGREAVAAGGLREGACEVGLACTGGSRDECDLVLTDPVTAGETKYDGLVEASWRAEVDVLEGGIEPELGELEKPTESPVLAFRGLAFEEHGEPILEGEGLHVGDTELLGKSLGHALESEFVEAVERRFD